jgi:hypothetical protein
MQGCQSRLWPRANKPTAAINRRQGDHWSPVARRGFFFPPSSAGTRNVLVGGAQYGRASRSLFDAVVVLTGLTPLVRDIEARLAADAVAAEGGAA